jgi:sarcosine oxidase subunit beta
MTERVDAVVVGGGIVGCAAAYYLAHAGVGEVLLVEADVHGAGATGGSFGGVRQQFAHPLEIEFSRRGLAFWKTVEERFDSPCPFHQDGYLLLTGDDGIARELGRAAETQRAGGLPDVHLLGPDQLRDVVPWLVPDGLVGGCWTPGDGHVMPMDGVFAFVKGGRAIGARFREHWRVERIERARGGLWRVIGPSTIEARHVVVAAGVHTRELLRPHGVDLDIRSITYYSVLTESAFVGQRVPMIIDIDTGLCVEREGDQLLLAMLSRGRVLRDHDDLTEQFSRAAATRMPALNELRIVKPVVGHPTVGGDGMPYVGQVEDGLWAIAFVGHGAMHGPPLAEVVAKAIAGRPDPVDISPWDVRRTPGPSTVWWRRKGMME